MVIKYFEIIRVYLSLCPPRNKPIRTLLWVSKEVNKRMMNKKEVECCHNQHLSAPLSPNLRSRTAMLDVRDSTATGLLECAHESVGLVQLLHVVAASYTFADKKDVRYRPPACHVCQQVLEFCTKRLNIQLDNERLGDDAIFLEEYVFRLLGVRAVRLGEDDYCDES